ncbi:hypothetical protein DL770_000934 [Monosporascus sp. CRB-9-2]|nr:hypothetical protein DL770_000934 [Monosporascus sp. CRB-9-2]
MAAKMDHYNVVALGDGGVGKTAFTIQICLNHFVETYDPTIDDSYRKQLVVDGRACMLEILDTPGQEEYTALRDQWIRDGEAFLLLYSITSQASFLRIQQFHNQIQRVKESTAPSPLYSGLPMPIAAVSVQAPVPIMLVGNKSDRVTERVVSTEEGQALARELGVLFVEASAKECYNVDKSVNDLIRMLRRQREAACRPAAAVPSPTRLPPSNERYKLRGNGGAYNVLRGLLRTPRISISAEEIKTEAGRGRLLAGLVGAAKTGNEKILLAYIDAGADVNVHSGADGGALHASAAAGHPNIVNILIKKGAAVNALSPAKAPPLQLAAAEGHLSVVRLLIHKGATIDQTSGLHGTALNAAASRGRLEVVRFLLKKGANVSIAGGPYGNALQAASWNGNPDVIRHLLDAGADITARGSGGCTALQMAAFVGKAGAIRVLLDRGARLDIDAPGGKYGSALKAATYRGHFEAVTLLLEAGAKPLKIENVNHGDAEEDDGDRNDEITMDDNTPRTPLQRPPPAIKSPTSSPEPVTSPSIKSPSPPIVPRILDGKSCSTQSLSLIPRRKINSLGFSTIHESPKAGVDIVFVHGLQGHPERTWTYTGSAPKLGSGLKQRFLRSVSTSSIEGPSSVYWPYDLLAQSEEFTETRILTWGYDTKVVKDFFGTSDQQNISQHGNNLMVSLQQERKTNPERPLIFVCHSLGGIVVKVALENSRKSFHQPQYLRIYKATRAILFLGTPHGGSGAADWGLIASNITKFVLQSPAQRVLRGLTPNSELLENLRRSFLQMLEDNHFGIHSFYETRAIVGMYGLNSLNSADYDRRRSCPMIQQLWATHEKKYHSGFLGTILRYADSQEKMIGVIKPFSVRCKITCEKRRRWATPITLQRFIDLDR